MGAPILFVGDLHLGRTPRRLDGAGLEVARLGPASALDRTVEAAIRHGVQAVVFAGDVVDQDKDRFEAWSVLHDAVAKLVRADVRVIGVAGNHDHIALPRLADRIEAFHLLGRGGTWEALPLQGVDLIGWSFPERHHRQDPLLSPGLDPALDARRAGSHAIGVLHGDLNVRESPYAPVQRAALEQVGLDAWFLGHIHQPGDLLQPRPIGYLGSIVGLDRSETGPRGPWLVTLEPAGTLRAEQLLLGPVAWTELALDVSSLPADDGALDALHVRIHQALAEHVAEHHWLSDGDYEGVGVSLHLTGRTHARSAVQQLAELSLAERCFPVAGIPWIVHDVVDGTRPAVDLEALAREPSPRGQIAALLNQLEAGTLADVPVPLGVEAFESSPWRPDPERVPLPDRDRVLRAALVHLLDQLLDQRGARQGG
ncbi:MAG: DNA repair exonuclease [Deltaproteobacteria bacterium]|nr:MAG: DNA repair exonuclease [Deltaproteobacteria bacterium]